MMKNILKIYDSNIYLFIIAVFVGVGTIYRFKGLGTWPLALDEYYIIKSSRIYKTWITTISQWRILSRGILLQYIIAIVYIGIKAEFAGRFFTVIANLITIPPIYLIAKRIGNQLIATVVVIMFSFSIWEIEFARFARMYTPISSIFIWYIYFAL